MTPPSITASRFACLFGGLLLAGLPAQLAAQTVATTPVVESGYTLFFLGFALVTLALYNLRRRSS